MKLIWKGFLMTFDPNSDSQSNAESAAKCSEFGSLMSLDAPGLDASSDVREPISLHKAVHRAQQYNPDRIYAKFLPISRLCHHTTTGISLVNIANSKRTRL